MASPEMLRIPVGQKVASENFLVEVVSDLLSSTITPNDTEEHESTHSVVALARGTGVVSTSVIPGDGYLGITQLVSFDAVAAMAPHGKGHKGTQWDKAVTEAQGHSAEAAASVGESIANSEKDVILEVAAHLQVKKTLSGSEISFIRDNVKKGEPVTVTRTDENGNTETFETRAKDGIVMFPSRLYDPEQKAA